MQRFPSLLLALAALGSAAGLSATEYSPATEEMARWDVESYSSRIVGSATHVDYFGNQGEVMATVEVHAGSPGGIILLVESTKTKGHPFTIVWEEARGLMSLQASSRGEALEASFNLQERSWRPDAGMEKLTARFEREIALAALALDQYIRSSETPRLSEVGACEFPGLSIASVNSKISGITCGDLQCRGFATGSVASGCCEEAWQDASNCCTNGICWGCCRFSSCDKKCFFGDYFCFCGVSGFKCTYVAF